MDNVKNILDEIQGDAATGTYIIDSESDVRRTNSFILQLDNFYRDRSIEKRLYLWMGYNFQIQIGIYSWKKSDYTWYDCGYYLITEESTTYNASEKCIL